MLWLAGDVKEPTRLSKRVGHEVPCGLAFVVTLRVGGECSEILVTIKLLYNPRVNKVFTYSLTPSLKVCRISICLVKPKLLKFKFLINTMAPGLSILKS